MSTQTETYRGWVIQFDPPPIPFRNCDWQFWHSDFDGADDVTDTRCGTAPSLEAAKAEIDEREDEFALPSSGACPINYPGCTQNCGNYGCGN